MYGDNGSMAGTGLGTLSMFGHNVSLNWVLAGAVALILAGALTYRLAKRKNKRSGR
jgi:hypothetical protein